MELAFKSERHKQLFKDLLGQLSGLGYRGDLLVQSYPFVDWFSSGNPVRIAPAAAFWTTPQSYDSACFVILVSNGRHGGELVADFRALGAPLAFEVREDSIVQWTVGKDAAGTHKQAHIAPEAMARVFRERERDWSRLNILQIKNSRLERGALQGDLFVDTGLIPALESHVRLKLGALLRGVVEAGQKVYSSRRRHPPDPQELFRLVFRFLAAKVLHDREFAPFKSHVADDAQAILADIQLYYGDPTGPVLSDAETRKVVCRELWSKVNFRNLSVETLAYIYENTLIDAQLRRRWGTHSTPHSIARYIVHHLPLEKLGEEERLIVDPFSGHGVFLVAALQRLRERLVSTNMTASERHQYFVARLRGFDIDAFAVEVATLCLVLADFPNRNGWKVYSEDVFTSERLATTLRRAGLVLSNPPFGTFSDSERNEYGDLTSAYKPVEFLHMVLGTVPATAMLGMVLPQQFIDGIAYRDVRAKLADRFEELEIVSLPDRIFHQSKIESALLIAKTPRVNESASVSVAFSEVRDAQRQAFLNEYIPTRRDVSLKTRADAEASFSVPLLGEVWEYLGTFKTLADVADIHRGLEWEGAIALHVSDIKRHGFERGIQKTGGRFYSYRCPPTKWLDTRRDQARARASGGFDLDWKKPKVIVNAARVSRDAWKIVAYADETGLVATQRFHGIWPKANTWSVRTLAAFLNGPVASAFIATHESARDVTVDTLRAVPIPVRGSIDATLIDELVKEYTQLISAGVSSATQRSLFSGDAPDHHQLTDLLLRIDALVLRAYRLPPRLERRLLDSFKNAQRPVGFPFPPYFPDSLTSTVPLWMYISPKYRQATPARFIDRAPEITDPDILEVLHEAE